MRGGGRGRGVELKEELVEFPEELRTSVLATKLADPSYRAFLRLVLAERLFFGADLDFWPSGIGRYWINAVKIATEERLRPC